MKRHKYNSSEEYVAAQSARNKHLVSIGWTPWISDEALAVLVDLLSPRHPKFGICHGTRSGREQAELSRLLGCVVLGTEISDTAEQFPNTLRWDFHEIKEEWIGSADFIYSNSLDHAHDPERALRNWMRCLRVGGLCFIDWSDGHGEGHVNEEDCFGASVEEMRQFLAPVAPSTVVSVKDKYAGHVLFILEKA